MITTRPWSGISPPDWFINSDTPHPLHLAAVFGLDETTAIRYSTATQKLLLTPAEHQHPG
jgi:hypothetical protein